MADVNDVPSVNDVLNTGNAIVGVGKLILGVGSTVLQGPSNLQDFKDDWFTVSDDYDIEVKIRRTNLEHYKERGPFPTNSVTMKRFEKVEQLLQREEKRIQISGENVDSVHCCCMGWWCYAKMIMTLFPEKSKNKLKIIDEAMDEFIKQLEEELKNGQLNPTTIHDNDGSYVPIEDTQNEVIKAIENFEGPPIILLHGGVGKGKSTLARHVCQYYEKHEVELVHQDGKGKGKVQPGEVTIFDHVLFEPCGKAAVSTVQFDILQRLAPHKLADSSQQGKDTKSRNSTLLQNFLSEEKVLIILDDVSSQEFLQEMAKVITKGKHAKYLVTSQKYNLCRHLSKISNVIVMKDPNQEEARKFFASLVGFDGKVIPETVKDIADEMISKTEGNPLALACLASNFGKGNVERRDWQETLKRFCDVLDSEDITNVLDADDEDVHEGEDAKQEKKRQNRTLGAAMSGCIASLETADAKVLLSFTYACKDESIPEEVLRMLHANAKTQGCRSFHLCRDELHKRELLKRNPRTSIVESEKPMSLSLRRLWKLYMEETKFLAENENLKSTIDALVKSDITEIASSSNSEVKEICSEIEIASSSNSEIKGTGFEIEIVDSEMEMESVVSVLCALYFDQGHKEPVVSNVAKRANMKSKLSGFDTSIIALQRKAIEPILWLIDQPEEIGKNWTASGVHCAKQVFLKYICERELDDDGVSHLLQLVEFPPAPLATLSAMRSMFSITEIPLLKENNVRFLKPLVGLLDSKKDVPEKFQKAASEALRGICLSTQKNGSASLVTSTPGILDLLVTSIEDFFAAPDKELDIFAQNAAHAFGCLAYTKEGCSQTELQIANKEGAVASLVRCLSLHDKPDLQQNAAVALQNLAGVEDASIKSTIANVEGLILGLVNSLTERNKPDLRTAAATALKNLVIGYGSIQSQIANAEGALSGLVTCLSAKCHPDLQEAAAMAFCNLTSGEDDSVIIRIANAEGVIPGLVNSLAERNKPDLRRAAAIALSNVALGNGSIQSQIANAEGALSGLVTCLSDKCHPDLQEAAARAFWNLTGAEDDSVKIRIANVEGVIPSLVNSLAESNKPDLRRAAAIALSNLALGNGSIQSQIANADGALSGLVTCLSDKCHPDLQEEAARAFWNLAAAVDDSVKIRIANVEGVIPGLVNSLAERNKPDLRRAAAIALTNLALGNGSIQSQIANAEGALSGLVTCLSDKCHPALQERAARAFLTLTCVKDDSILIKLANMEGLMQGLVNALANRNKPRLRTTAANALHNLAVAESLKSNIVDTEGALPHLVDCLFEHDEPNVQEAAADALRRLVRGDDVSIKMKIACQERALSGLIKCLSRLDRPDVQKAAARALDDVASGEDVLIGNIIANEEGALPALVNCLHQDNNPVLRIFAARALSRVAAVKDEYIKKKIANQEGAIQGLAKCLSDPEMLSFDFDKWLSASEMSDSKDAMAKALKILSSVGRRGRSKYRTKKPKDYI